VVGICKIINLYKTMEGEGNGEKIDVIITDADKERLREMMDKHPFLERGREKAAKFVEDENNKVKGIMFLGVGKGGKVEAIANENLEKVVAVDKSLDEKLESEIKNSVSENCSVEVGSDDFNSDNFKIPEGIDTVYMGNTFHDQTLGQQKALLGKLRESGVEYVILCDIYMPNEVGPNYKKEDESEDDARGRVKKDIEKIYAGWFRALEARDDRDVEIYKKIVTGSGLQALESMNSEKEDKENFDTVETITDKMKDAGYKLTEKHDLEDTIYVKTLVFKSED